MDNEEEETKSHLTTSKGLTDMIDTKAEAKDAPA